MRFVIYHFLVVGLIALFAVGCGGTQKEDESASNDLGIRIGMSIEEVERQLAALGAGDGIGRQSDRPSEGMPEFVTEKSWWTRLRWDRDSHRRYVFDFNYSGQLIRLAQIETLYPAEKPEEPFEL